MQTQEEAEEHLLEVVRITQDRDARILQALQAGATKHRIHQLTGYSRSNLDRILEEYPVIDTAAVLRARARAVSGLTAAEFDYSLATGGTDALVAMNNAAYELANQHMPGFQEDEGAEALAERRQRGEDLWRQVRPEVEAMVERSKRMRFTGWSDAARVRGGRVNYAT